MARILHVIQNADFRCRHEGLVAIAKKAKVDMSQLKVGDIVVFLNVARDRLICISVLPEQDSFGLLSYYRSPHGRVPMEAIQFIPQAFGVTGLNMNAAIRSGLEQLLKKKARKS